MQVIKVLEPGPFTTVQDGGRFGYQRYGMAPAGAMDEVAYRLGNLMLGNDANAASLEFTLKGPRLEILDDTILVVTGGHCVVNINGSQEYPVYEPVKVKEGDQVEIGWITEGVRGYVIVQGGLDLPAVMQSRSTYLRGRIGGVGGAQLKGGEVLAVLKEHGPLGRALPGDRWPSYQPPFVIDVIMGPQADFFTKEGIETFLEGDFQISEAADRMGYRLTGPEVMHVDKADIISDGIPLGAIQVPGHRQPIIMMKDRQTTGGYPKIATAASYEIYRLGQAKPGDGLSFKKVSIEEAKEKKDDFDKWYHELAEYVTRPGNGLKHFKVIVDGKSFFASIKEID